MLGHGNGEANASGVGYVEKYRHDVAAKLVADVRVDIDHIDEEQVLRLAQAYFDEAPRRALGDSRRMEPEGPLQRSLLLSDDDGGGPLLSLVPSHRNTVDDEK